MSDFIHLYDSAPTFSLKGFQLEEAYEKLGLDSTHSLVRSRVSETVRERLYSIINVEDENEPHVSFLELKKYREYWFYQDQINDISKYEPYILAITRLIYSFGSKLKYLIPFSESEKWKEAMSLLKCLMEDGHNLNYDLELAMERQIDRVKAIKRLKKLGVKVNFDDEKKEVACDDLTPIYRKISAIIEKVGGARSVVFYLKRHTFYNANHHRLTQHRQMNRLGAIKPDVEVPLAYLLNLAFNKLSYRGNERYLRELAEAEQLAKDVCAVEYEAQTYTIWNDIFYDKDAIDSYFQRLIIWDSIYTIPQCSPVFVRDLIAHLVTEFDQLGMKPSDKYTLHDYDRFMNYMIDRAQMGLFTQMRFETAMRELKMPEVKLRALWSDVTECAGSVRYVTPLDFDYLEIFYQPAYLMPNKDLLLYPVSLGAMGWYEVLTRGLRKWNGKVENKLGDLLESFLHKQFALHDIPSKTGKYFIKKVQGDCDAAIEDDEHLLLMELKKKTMTRQAKSGHLFRILLDLAAALFIPQQQAFKTETFLLENGKIDLDKDGKLDELENKNKHIEKLAVALTDFGSLHDRAIFDRVLDIFLRYDFNFKEQEVMDFLGDAEKTAEVMDSLDKLHKRQEDMRNYVNRLIAIQPDLKPDRIFFNSGFFSLEQVYFILSISSNTKDFIDKILDMKYTLFCTKDFWAEVDFKLNLMTKYQEL
jgi:hypothetical protein